MSMSLAFGAAPWRRLLAGRAGFNLADEITALSLAIEHALPVFKRHRGGVILNIRAIAGVVGAAKPGNIAGNVAHS